MRPDLTDLLSGIQRLLQGDISAGLSDPYLQEQAAYASLLLEYAKKAWVREHLAIAEEHADLANCVAAIATHLQALAAAEAQALAADLRAALSGPRLAIDETPLDRVLAVDRERRALLERTIELVGSSADAPGPGAAPAASGDARAIRAVQSAIDAYLVRAAHRRDAALATLGVSW